LSGAIHRGLDFYYLCYDNEAYGNTGFQMSSASPLGSHTATTPPAKTRPAGTTASKKDLFEIWRAHRPPYIATLSTADPVDLTDKVRRSKQFRGPKLFTAFATCPPGWGYDPSQGHHLAKLALETGIWPLKEFVQGRVRHTYIPDRRRPVEEYLRTQRRFQHLFSPRRQEEALHEIQTAIDAYWDDVTLCELPQNRGAALRTINHERGEQPGGVNRRRSWQ
jgi:pyruvate ferredoxin oxidoreductase beta subunit